MEYTVKELRSDILSKISALGITPRFRENPAFSSALAEIDSLIESINLSSNGDDFKVRQDGKTITLTCHDDENNYYALGISCYEPESFRCLLVTEKNPDLLEEGIKRRKTAIEKDVSLKDNNYITILTSGSTVDELEEPNKKCHNSVWREIEKYSSLGIMLNKDYYGYNKVEYEKGFDEISVDSMLYIPRKAVYAPDRGILELQNERTLLAREYLDTAYIFKDNKKEGKTYCARIPLNQDKGLRNMNIDDIYDLCPKNIYIPPTENWEIDLMLTSEGNQSVQDGLKNLSIGRCNYTYDSSKDRNFIRQGYEDTPQVML